MRASTVEEGIVKVEISRPKAMNALTTTMCLEAAQAFEKLDRCPAVRVIVLTGDPASPVFCAGADLGTKESKEAGDTSAGPWGSPSSTAEHRDIGGVMTLALFRCRHPVIAAINGSAVGAGITTTLACDMRVVNEEAKVGFPFARRGIVPESASSYFLPRIVGIAKAAEWCMTGRVFMAKDEVYSGLFSYVVPGREDVLPKAMALAREIRDHTSPASVSLTKGMLWRQPQDASPEATHLLESRLLAWCFAQPDALEGAMSFKEKRLPRFRTSGELAPDYPWWRELEIRSRL